MDKAHNSLSSPLARIARSLRYRLQPQHLIDFLKVDVLLRILAQAEQGALRQARRDYAVTYQQPNDPLISITIATYNRSDILLERTLPSVFGQSYQNFEIIIVGDGCTDNTFERLATINDSRLRLINLPERGKYPENRAHRHFVAGTYPINRALQEVKGTWIAHLDDDEVWTPDHLESLLRFAQKHALEFACGYALVELSPGNWQTLTSSAFKEKQGRLIHHSTVLFRAYLRLFRLDPKAWWYNIGVDWHSFMRMAYCGVKSGVLEQVVNHAPLRPGTTQPWAAAEDRT